ncbi:M24 family metallopeptidase [Haloparvum sp. PAK95]|uniref:M24 family metallopeptidase n=1 Tax=Haloparvum sp. PAK95 TaxID=3418962 RepID=UPI003D2F1494
MVDPSARAERLDEYLAARDLEAVWFARPNGFAWLTGGSNVVDRSASVGVAAAGYDGEFRVVTTAGDADRLREEELPGGTTGGDDGTDTDTDVDVAVEETAWYEESLAEAVAARSPEPAAADFDVTGFESVDGSRLRQPLTAEDVERYRELGRETAAAVETVCRQLQSDDPEYEVAAAIRISLSSRDVETPVILVGGGDRAANYGRPTPGDEELGDYAVVSVVGERGGLFASLTRTVVFDAPEWLKERHRAAARIETTALSATQAAARGELAGSGDAATDPDAAGDVFGAIQDAYAAVDFAEEWRDHPQGGAAGYDTREWVATPDATDPVRAPMGYAWNPWVRGAKSEDTYLVTADRIENLTKTGQWPTLEVDAVGAVPELTLDRHAPTVL